MSDVAVITIGIDPTIEIGPLTIAWHGLMIGIGIVAGAVVAARYARERGWSADPLYGICTIAAVAGLIGGKLFYVAERGWLLEPARWVSGSGFTFNGGFIAAAIAIAVYLRRTRVDLAYLDVVAVGLPLGVAVGRIGDVVNGEHFGPPSAWLLAVRNTHPDALVPSPDVAYHSGGLYEVMLGIAVFAVVWPLRHSFRRPFVLTWLVVGLLAAGRFVEFFFRSDSDEVALGLNSAQWTSAALVAGSALGFVVTSRFRHSSGVRARG